MSHDHERRCSCVTDHRPAVVELDRHHILPLYLGGPDVDSNVVWICPNTHRAAHEALRLLLKGATDLSEFPRRARDLARDGYARWKATQ